MKAYAHNDDPTGEIPIGHIRPRFMIKTDLGGNDLKERLREKLRMKDSSCVGEAHERYAAIYIPLPSRHYWSPRLTLTYQIEEGEMTIRGTFGPSADVWTMIAFFYGLVAFSIVVILGIGLSLITMGDEASVLWALPFQLLALLSIFLVAQQGKAKGKDQMVTLYRFFQESTGLSIES